MRKTLLPGLCGLIVATGMLWVSTPSAKAIKAFKDQFEAKYVKPDSTEPGDVALAKAVAEAKCYVCHEKGSKKNRNAYGRSLSELLDRKEDKENVEKIQESLDAIAALKSNPDDADSPTFGELLGQGKLPVDAPE